MTGNDKTLVQRIRHQLDKHDIKAVRFEVADSYGVPRCRLIPARHFESRVLEGQYFAGSCFGTDPSGFRINGDFLHPNIRLGDVNTFPDLDTFSVLPWCKSTARVISEPMVDGIRASFIPRNIAVRQLDRLMEMGFSLLSGYEHEFVIYDKVTKEPIVDDRLPTGTTRLIEAEDFVMQLLDDLPKVGLDVDAIEAEVTPGMMEVTYRPSYGIKGPDSAYVCKNAIKEVARKNGLLASFMTRPFNTDDTVTMHFNHSLWDVHQQTPLLDDKQQLSEVGQQWIAGIVAHCPGITALMAPTVNCIRALGGSEPTLAVAPINATWGTQNRSVAVNIKLAGDKSSYVENRMSMGGSDPYTVLAATVAAGMDGITRKLTLPDEVKGNAHDETNIPRQTLNLPATMKEAVHALLDDNVIRESLGDDFIECFVAAKRHEIKALTAAPDRMAWEHKIFFQNI